MEYELDLTYSFESSQYIRVAIVPISPRNDYSSPRFKFYAEAIRSLGTINSIELPLEQETGRNPPLNLFCLIHNSID